MARTSKQSVSKTEEEVLEQQVTDEAKAAQETVEETPSQKESEKEEKIPQNVLRLMKMYPQYEEMYITPQGFVHPAGTPEYARKGAKLYKNKFFNK